MLPRQMLNIKIQTSKKKKKKKSGKKKKKSWISKTWNKL